MVVGICSINVHYLVIDCSNVCSMNVQLCSLNVQLCSLNVDFCSLNVHFCSFNVQYCWFIIECQFIKLVSLRKLFYFVQWTYSLENWTLNAQKKDCSLNVQTCSFVFKKKFCVEPNDKNLFIDRMTMNNFERSLNNRWTTFEQW